MKTKRSYPQVSQRWLSLSQPGMPSAHADLSQRGRRCPRLPSFTFDLDIMLLLSHLRLSRHVMLGEAHRELQEWLAPIRWFLAF